LTQIQIVTVAKPVSYCRGDESVIVAPDDLTLSKKSGPRVAGVRQPPFKPPSSDLVYNNDAAAWLRKSAVV
jgi:hypothetical protein